MSITFSHKSALELYRSPFLLELLPYYHKTNGQLWQKAHAPRRVALSRCSIPTRNEVRALEIKPLRIKPLSNINNDENVFSSLSLPTRFVPNDCCTFSDHHAFPTRFSLADYRSTPFYFSLPLHVLVDHANKRRAIENLICHVKDNSPDVIPLPNLPEKMKASFVLSPSSFALKSSSCAPNPSSAQEKSSNHDVNTAPTSKLPNQDFTAKTYYLIPPEYLFLQMAESMSFIDLLMLGFELCGTYFGNQATDTFNDSAVPSPRHKPFTKANKIKRLLDSDVASQTKGTKQAKQAAKFLLDNSYSPRESALALMLTLPRRLGGYALPRPLLNQRINIPRNNSQLTHNDHFRCDLFWPKENLAIEYDSDLHHTDARKIAKDASRRDALALLGIQVITVTNKQFASMKEMDKVAHTVAKILGVRQRNEKRYNYQTRKIQLLQQLQ